MFGFGKKQAKTPEERIPELEKKKDWAGLVKAYYELGVSAMDSGELNKAQLWLHRADTIYSADDAVYEKVGDKLTDDCSDRIGALEEEDGLLYNSIPAEVEDKAEGLGDPHVRVWGLLSIARLVKLGKRLSALPGCQVLGELGWAVEMMYKSFLEPPTQEDYQKLMDICNSLYELGDSEAFFGGGQIDVPGRAPFQVFDLNGMGVLLELNGYLDNHLRFMAALSQGADPPAPESGAVGCALLPDYYVRTLGGSPEDVPQVKAELDRIRSDYEFVRPGSSWGEVAKRIDQYQELDILQ